MSKLSYKIQQSIDEMDEMDGKKVKPVGIMRVLRIVKYFAIDLWYDYPYVWIYNIRAIYCNLCFFMPHIRHMRDWDSSYQISLFCDSLEYLANGLRRHDNCLHSQRHYRRCLFAAKRLRNAYDDRSYNDKSYVSLSKKNPIRFVKIDNGMSQMTHDYSNTKEYYNKMFKVIHKRTEAAMKAEKADAWAYINKHIQSWWD